MSFFFEMRYSFISTEQGKIRMSHHFLIYLMAKKDFAAWENLFINLMFNIKTFNATIQLHTIKTKSAAANEKYKSARIIFTNLNRLTIKNYWLEMSNHVKTAHKFNNKPVLLCCVGQIAFFIRKIYHQSKFNNYNKDHWHSLLLLSPKHY